MGKYKITLIEEEAQALKMAINCLLNLNMEALTTSLPGFPNFSMDYFQSLPQDAQTEINNAMKVSGHLKSILKNF